MGQGNRDRIGIESIPETKGTLVDDGKAMTFKTA
jgi:hypothetical protein